MTGMRVAPRLFGWIVLLVLCMASAGPAAAQLYRWTDERGELNFVQGLENVPERHRRGAVMVGYPDRGTTPAPAAPAAPGGSAPAGPRPGPAASGPAAEGILARVPFVPGAPILVTARINGGRSVRLLLDTGASHTTISPRALSALGVDMRASGRVQVRGVTGSAEAVTIMLDSLEVGEARVAPLEVTAHDANMVQGDGLLGRDFLDRFQVNIDTAGRMVLIGRR